MKKKFKIVFIFILIILIIFVILFLIKFYKVNKIIDLIKLNNNKNNYSYLRKDLMEKVEFDYYIKCNKNLIIAELKLNNNYLHYYDFNNNEVYYFDNENKVYFKEKAQLKNNIYLFFPLYEYLTSDYSFKNKLKLVFEWKIRDYDKNNYEITTSDNYKIIFNKTTGFVSRVISLDLKNKHEIIIEDFKENSVTDEDTKLPDLSEYSLVENN